MDLLLGTGRSLIFHLGEAHQVITSSPRSPNKNHNVITRKIETECAQLNNCCSHVHVDENDVDDDVEERFDHIAYQMERSRIEKIVKLWHNRCRSVFPSLL